MRRFIWFFHVILLAIFRVEFTNCAGAEPKEGSFLVQESNVEEFRQLRDLLGEPVGDAKTAKATKGKKKTTRFMPKCPKKLTDAPGKTREIILKRCPELRNKEYNNQEKEVAKLIMNANKKKEKNYQQQKKELMAAVNHLAKLAGPLPSI